MQKLRINQYVIIQLAIDLSQALGYLLNCKKAVQIGYTLLKVYQYDTVTKYDPITGDGGLFAQYMNTFMKIKMETSGYPAHCDTDQEKNKSIKRVRAHKGLLCVQMTFHSM